MSATHTAVALAALMCSASVIATLGQPAPGKEQRTPGIQLESAIPQQFATWRIDPAQRAQVVNPQTQQLLDKLYGQVLARTYVNDRGYRVMLSLAYGSDQRGALQAHKPEACYAAQGFSLLRNDAVDIGTSFGQILGRRLNAQLGTRVEPITYWFTLGDQTVRSRFERRMAEVRIGLTGQIPDGLLFRVSSIDSNTAQAYVEHDRFVNDLLAAVKPIDRARLSGLVDSH
jgi:EpsI family protein